MPSKKKGSRSKGSKGKKKDNLTDEQKQKLTEQKALAEQEKLARRRQLTNAYLSIKKDKELELIKLNNNKLLDLWRPRLRKLKIQELMDDYKIMRHAFERAFDKKHHYIKKLEDMLKKNEGDYDGAVDMHMQNIDKLMEFYQKRLKEIHDAYAEEKDRLLDSLRQESDALNAYQENSLKYLNTVMNAEKARYKEMRDEASTEIALCEDELRNKCLEEMMAMKCKMNKKMEEFWREIHQRLVSYDTASLAKRNEFENLLKQDEELCFIIDEQFGTLRNLQEGINHMECKTMMFKKALANFTEQILKKKQEYKELHLKNIREYKLVMKFNREDLTFFSICAQEALKKLDWAKELHERLGKQIDLNCKLERKDEKTDPYLIRWGGQSLFQVNTEYKAILVMAPQLSEKKTERKKKYDESKLVWSPEEASENQSTCQCDPCFCDDEEPGEEVDFDEEKYAPVDDLMGEFQLMEKFWIRFNRVVLEKATLEARRASFHKDNFNLRFALRNYMGGMNPYCYDVFAFSYQVAVGGLLFPYAHALTKESECSESTPGLHSSPPVVDGLANIRNNLKCLSIVPKKNKFPII